jgi:hypothetical protein
MLDIFIKTSLWVTFLFGSSQLLHASDYRLPLPEEECSSNGLFNRRGEYIGCEVISFSDPKEIFSNEKMSERQCIQYCYNAHRNFEVPACTAADKILDKRGSRAYVDFGLCLDKNLKINRCIRMSSKSDS